MTHQIQMLTIDCETADRITVSNLVQHRDFIKEQLDKHEAGGWMHADDVKINRKLVKTMTRIIEYFGG